MQRILVIAIACLLAKTSGTDTNYRLNTPIVPKAYTIIITPYFDTGDSNAFTFDGEVSITLTTTAVTKQIKLHSENLDFNADNVTVSAVSGDIALANTEPLIFDANYTFVYINLASELQVGVEYTLTISYRGPIREDLNGFYRNYYFENGVKKWLGATQMEPTHARKAFPCFDEPGLKATFTLIVDRPQNYKPSLANTKLQTTVTLSNGYVREVFYPTPIMPTYLVAFMVSQFDAALADSTNGREFAIYTRPEAVNQSSYTFDFGTRVEKALSDFYGIDYYSVDSNLKLDHVALPDFRAGAMENWGLVKYREALLLYVPEESTPYYKYRVAQIVAHETTHMWFGNLVTCHWWSNTWLNEGFANYFQDYITALIEPEVGSANQLVIGSVYSAYGADNFPSSAPITNNDVNSPAEISGHFGTITYQKGGSVIRMMHHFIGDVAFKYALHEYLDVNRFGSGYPELLYSALENGVKNNNSLASYPGISITDVMKTWITQAGHPLLHVHVNYTDDTVTLTQKRFYINSSHSSNETYSIPITYTTGQSPDFENTKPVFVMTGKTHEFQITNISKTHTWVIFNIQETGFYRVTYDEHTWEHIGGALKGSSREKIHHLNRAKIVNDLFDLYYADEVSFSLLIETLEFLKEETENAVWFAAIKGLNKLWNSYLGDSALEDIERLALKFIDNAITTIGYEVRATDDFSTLTNRLQLLEFACKIGHQGCIENTVSAFKRFKDTGVSVSPSLRPVTYCSGLRFGDASDYEFLWERMSTTNVANEARVISGVLGCSTDEGSLKKFLFSVKEENSPIRTQDLTVPLTGVLSNHSHIYIVMDSLKQNYSAWSSIHTSMDTILSTVAAALHTEDDFTDMETWLSICTECSEQSKLSARTALSGVRASSEWSKKHREEIVSALKSGSSVNAPSLIIFILSIAVVLFKF